MSTDGGSLGMDHSIVIPGQDAMCPLVSRVPDLITCARSSCCWWSASCGACQVMVALDMACQLMGLIMEDLENEKGGEEGENWKG